MGIDLDKFERELDGERFYMASDFRELIHELRVTRRRRDEFNDEVGATLNCLQAAHEERDRYRAALERMLKCSMTGKADRGCSCTSCDIARAALEAGR